MIINLYKYPSLSSMYKDELFSRLNKNVSEFLKENNITYYYSLLNNEIRLYDKVYKSEEELNNLITQLLLVS